MTTHIATRITVSDQAPPRCYLSGATPIIEFGEFPNEALVAVRGSGRVAYLRKFAAELSDFADVVEQAQAVSVR